MTHRFVLALALLTAIGGCSHSPTEPSSLASLSGRVQLCGFDTLTVLTVTDSKGATHNTSLDTNGNYSFPQALALGKYRMTATRAPLPTQSIDSINSLQTGPNSNIWIDASCASMTVILDGQSCTPFINGSVNGTLAEVSTGWHTDSVTLTPGQSATAVSLPAFDNYRILFNGVYKDGRSVQWDYTQNAATTSTFTMTCSATLNSRAKGPTAIR